jgi:hypothetical protein
LTFFLPPPLLPATAMFSHEKKKSRRKETRPLKQNAESTSHDPLGQSHAAFAAHHQTRQYGRRKKKRKHRVRPAALEN